jgi:sugar diacid utilization regulator
MSKKRVSTCLRTHFPDIDKQKSIESKCVYNPAATVHATNHSIDVQNKKLQQLLVTLNENLDLSDSEGFRLLDRLDKFQENVEALVDTAEQLNIFEGKLGQRLNKIIKRRAFDVLRLRLANKADFIDEEFIDKEVCALYEDYDLSEQ